MLLFNLRRKRKPKYKLLSGKFEGMEFVGHYDFGLLSFKAKSQYPFMLGVSIQGFQTDARKLPTNAARPAIDDFEDTLTAIVEKSANTIYAGHTFWNGALEVIFYIQEHDQVIKELEKEAGKDHILSFSFKVDWDPEWKQLDRLTFTG